jgi:hypothetical protein
MKSDISTFVLPAAAASQRPMLTTQANSNQLRFRFKTPHLLLLLGLIAPLQSFASSEAPYCIAVNGGFVGPATGTTFVARNFSQPAEGKCTQWTGYTKTLDSVILTTSGTSCLSSDSKALTVAVSSIDPPTFYIGQYTADYIFLTRGDSSEPFSGQDTGAFAGPAEPVSCTSDLLNLPSSHD